MMVEECGETGWGSGRREGTVSTGLGRLLSLTVVVAIGENRTGTEGRI